MLSNREIIDKLHILKQPGGEGELSEKLRLLQLLESRVIESAASLKRLHEVLCYLSAFPDHQAIYQKARSLLSNFRQRVAKLRRQQRALLDDSGIANTTLQYPFFFQSAAALARLFPGKLEINWRELEDQSILEDICMRLSCSAEEQTFTADPQAYVGGKEVTARQWLKLASGGGSELDWLLREISASPQHRELSGLYDRAEVPLRMRLTSDLGSIGSTQLPIKQPSIRQGLRQIAAPLKKRIMRPLRAIKRLPVAQGQAAIDALILALAARQREIYGLGCANPGEVYRAELGQGVALYVIGAGLAERPLLEANYFYMLTANGMPIGYGGVSPLFYQANTGLNIFAEYRKSEAAFLWIECLRAFRSLFGVNRFVINPYQFGADNSEGRDSGAFWFYYKLGFRPIDKKVAALAKQLAQTKNPPTLLQLKQLLSCDLHLPLAGSKRSQFFREPWLGAIALGVSAKLSEEAALPRLKSLRNLLKNAKVTLGVRDVGSWGAGERLAFERLAPLVYLLPTISLWRRRDRQALIHIMRDKGASDQRRYVIEMQRHERFFGELIEACRKIERQMAN